MKSSKTIVEEYLKKKDWRVRESSSSPYSYGGLGKYMIGEVSKDYWLREVYPDYITQEYLNGKMHIHDLGVLSLYTYYGKEVIIVKSPSDNIKMLSIEDFYRMFSDKEQCVNQTDDVWQTNASGWLVLDKNGWTDISKLTRKKKHREMRFIKSEVGRSVIVTDNHPMITQTGEKQSSEVTEDDKIYSANLKCLLSGEKLFQQTQIDLLELMPEKIGKFNVYADGLPIKEKRNSDNISYIHTQQHSLPRFIPLTSDFGFAIGFILAEGFLSYRDNKHSRISFNSKNKDDVNRTMKGLKDVGCTSTLRIEGNINYVEITNLILICLIRDIMGIKNTSRNKNLPNNILEYNKNFIYGVISGVIDGDGTINKTEVNIRVSARTMIEQIALVLQLLDICVRDRKVEGQGTKRTYNDRIIVQNYPLYGIGFNVRDDNITSRKYIQADKATASYKTTMLDEWHNVVLNAEVNIPDEYIYDVTTSSHTLLVNGMYNHNCCGYSLKSIIQMGVQGIPNVPTSLPAKHFDSILNQLCNIITIYQNEIAG